MTTPKKRRHHPWLPPLCGPSLAGNLSRTFALLSGSCNIPSEAKAYSLNYTSGPNRPQLITARTMLAEVGLHFGLRSCPLEWP